MISALVGAIPLQIAAWTCSLETGERYEIEHRIRRADGEYLWFQTRGLPVRAADNRILGWHILLTDIAERKRAEALLAAELATGHGVRRGRGFPLSFRTAERRETANARHGVKEDHSARVETCTCGKQGDRLAFVPAQSCNESPQFGVDVKVAQELLRHANSGITMDLYTQAVSADKRMASGRQAEMSMAGKNDGTESSTVA